MFTINYKDENEKFKLIELLVHGDLTLFRKIKLDNNQESNWEVKNSSGKWEEETILDDIVEELFNSDTPAYFQNTKRNKP
jgi:hypothetical protein